MLAIFKCFQNPLGLELAEIWPVEGVKTRSAPIKTTFFRAYSAAMHLLEPHAESAYRLGSTNNRAFLIIQAQHQEHDVMMLKGQFLTAADLFMTEMRQFKRLDVGD